MSDLPTWERRFRAPLLAFPSWATDAPDRLVMASTESGSYQLHTWDRATGVRRQVTDDPVGDARGPADPRRQRRHLVPRRDGRRVRQLRHRAVRRATSGRSRCSRACPDGWTEGLAIGRTRTIAGAVHRGGLLGLGGRARRRRAEDPRARRARPPRRRLGPDQRRRPQGALERRVDRRARGHGGRRRAAPVAPLDRRADRRDRRGPPRRRAASCPGYAFSPIEGDTRIAITHERTGEERPATWDARTGDLVDLPTDLEGPVEPVDWWPDGSALLLLQLVEGRHRLHRYDLADRHAHDPRHRAGLDHRGRRPARRRGLVPRPQRHAPGEAARGRVRRRRCSRRRAPARPTAGRSSRGGSRTPTASGSTGSSSAPTATARTR